MIFHRYPNTKERAITNASEKNYSQIEHEALSVILGIKSFINIFGIAVSQSKQIINHYSRYLATRKVFQPQPLAAYNIGQSSVLMGYSFDIEYKNTREFGNADGLSQLPVGPDVVFDSQDPGNICAVHNAQQELLQNLQITANDIVKSTHTNSVLSKLKYYTLNSWPQKKEEFLPLMGIIHTERQHPLGNACSCSCRIAIETVVTRT